MGAAFNYSRPKTHKNEHLQRGFVPVSAQPNGLP